MRFAGAPSWVTGPGVAGAETFVRAISPPPERGTGEWSSREHSNKDGLSAFIQNEVSLLFHYGLTTNAARERTAKVSLARSNPNLHHSQRGEPTFLCLQTQAP